MEDWAQAAEVVAGLLIGAIGRHYGGKQWDKRKTTNPLGGNVMEALRKIQDQAEAEQRRNAEERGKNEVWREQYIAELRILRQTISNAFDRFFERSNPR